MFHDDWFGDGALSDLCEQWALAAPDIVTGLPVLKQGTPAPKGQRPCCHTPGTSAAGLPNHCCVQTVWHNLLPGERRRGGYMNVSRTVNLDNKRKRRTKLKQSHRKTNFSDCTVKGNILYSFPL